MRIESPPRLKLAGVGLRALKREDLQAWYAYLSNPSAVEHTSWNVKSPSDLEKNFDELYESLSPTSARRLAIVDSSTDRLIGTIGFHSISDVNRSAEIAYDLAPSHWGRGIATEACRALVEWAFAEYGWIRIQATTLDSNQPSQAVLEKCGFKYEGLLRAYRMVRGKPGDFKNVRPAQLGLISYVP